MMMMMTCMFREGMWIRWYLQRKGILMMAWVKRGSVLGRCCIALDDMLTRRCVKGIE